jgi:hypothetical protein
MGVFAPVRRLRAHRELLAARRAADTELLRTRLPSPRLAWRTNELCSADHRRDLAASVVEVVRASETRFLPGASPLDRVAARDEVPLLLSIAALLADTGRRVSPRGVLLVERLFAGDSSPLYNRSPANRLHRDLVQALETLEGTR